MIPPTRGALGTDPLLALASPPPKIRTTGGRLAPQPRLAPQLGSLCPRATPRLPEPARSSGVDNRTKPLAKPVMPAAGPGNHDFWVPAPAPVETDAGACSRSARPGLQRELTG